MSDHVVKESIRRESGRCGDSFYFAEGNRLRRGLRDHAVAQLGREYYHGMSDGAPIYLVYTSFTLARIVWRFPHGISTTSPDSGSVSFMTPPPSPRAASAYLASEFGGYEHIELP